MEINIKFSKKEYDLIKTYARRNKLSVEEYIKNSALNTKGLSINQILEMF